MATAAEKYLTPDASSGGTTSSHKSGGLFGLHLPDLGVGNLIHEVGAIPGSLVRLGASFLPGGEPAGAVASAMGKGLTSSFVGTGLAALDVGSLGALHGYTDQLRDQWGNILGGDQYRPQSLMEQYNQGGILPTAVTQIGNVAAGASAAGKLASLGDVGTAANAAAAAGRAAEAGWTAEDIAKATEAAKAGSSGFREAGISSEALKLAGKAAAKAEGLDALDPAAVASRAKLLNVLHDVAHPYRSFFNGVLSPLGQAASERLNTEALGPEEAASAAEPAAAAAEPAAAATPEAPSTEPVAPAEAPVATQGAQTATEPGSVATAPPVPDVHQNLLDAMAEAVKAHSGEEATAKEAAINDARREAALDGVKPEDRVTLYRGQEGPYSPGVPAGEHWTDKLSYAKSIAGPNGHVLETVVPKDVAERAQAEGVGAGHFANGAGSHMLPSYWADLSRPVEGSATAAAADHATTITDALAAKAEPAAAAVTPPAAELPNTLGLTKTDVGPVQEAVQRAASVPTPQWAAKTVAKLPDHVVRALSKSDRFIAARQTGMVLKERLRMQDVNRREILNSDALRVPKNAAQQFLVGKTLEDGTKITPKLADNLMGDELIARLTETSAIEDVVARRATPADLRRVMVESGARAERSIPREWLRDAAGEPTELGKLIDDSIEHLRNAATERTNTLLSTSEKGLEHVADTMPALSARGQAMMRSATDDLREIAKLEASKIPRDRVLAAREMQRLQDELKKVAVEAQANHAAAKAASEAFDVTRSPVKDSIVGHYNDVKEGFKEAQGERIAPTPLRRAQSTPDVGGLTEHGAYRRGVVGGRAVENMQAAADKAAELETRRAQLAKNLEDVKRTLIEHSTPSEIMRDKLAARSDRRLTAAARQLEHPALGGVPTQWKPMWDSLTKLHEEAAYKPDLQEALHEVPHTWSTVLKVAAEQGFNPEHVRSFQPSEVRKLVYDSVSLGHRGRDLGQTISAGTRKNRIAAQARTRSLDALAAGIIEATHETHTNALAKFVDDTWARPVVDGLIPAHGVAWDPERSFLLTGKKTDMGTTLVKGLGAPTKWVPREVKQVLDAYQRDYHHGVFDVIRKVTDPWRMLMLTLSPKWYVNHIVGHIIMTTKEGVSLADWVKAWQSFREGGADLTRNRFMQKFGAGADSFKSTSGAVAGGLKNEVAHLDSVVSYPRGLEGLKMAKEEGGMGDALRMVQQRIARPATLVDELGRVATYFNGVKKGMTDAEALNRTYHALVDFTDLSPAERQVVRQLVPFYAFQKGMLKIVAKFPLDHPAIAGTSLILDKVNRDLSAEEFNGELPRYYQDMFNVGGKFYPMKAFDPFMDADTLTTPQGIAQSMNPFVGIPVRNALGAPSGASYQRTNDFGKSVDDTSPAQDLTDLFAGLPQTKLAEGVSGTSISGQQLPGAAASAANYAGARTYDPAALQALVDKLNKTKASKAAKQAAG